jgi:ribonuclease HI
MESSYSWSLSTHSNNLVEAYGLLQGMKIAKLLNIHNLVVIGDSFLIIKYIQQGTFSSDARLASVLGRIRHLNSSFSTMRFYHVLRDNNYEADMYASLDTRKKEGTLIINNEVTNEPIP